MKKSHQALTRMTAKADKTTEALNALQKIRERVKPQHDSTEAPKEETTEEEYHGVQIIDNIERGLVQVFFPHMPTEKARRYLKKHGFTWDSSEQCWKCERAENAGYHAKRAVDLGTQD